MSMSDPIADMLTRIRNGLSAGKSTITMPSSKAKTAIAKVLADEGFVTGYELTDTEKKPTLNVTLKYYRGEPVIEELTRVSKPGWRVYCGADELPSANGGLGIVVISTSRGLMTDKQARTEGLGGEVLCRVC